MDQLDEQSFLDELMSLRREEAPVPAPAPWQAYPGSGMMTTSDLLLYGGDGTTEASSGMDFAGPIQQPMAPPPGTSPHGPHEEFNFDCLSEVCNPYRSCVGVVPRHGVAHGAGQALSQFPLHDAMAEDGPSGGNLHRGGGSSSSPVPIVFGAGGAGESPEMIRGVLTGAHARGKLNGGTTSKNLMAERRRRKRLNDRLSMLRSIVPKITKVCGKSQLALSSDLIS
uniref:BHLH domain-containing protein n=1 Tax=Aegilops tauschii subsp. strangulata TaxID=200361 RepID=A0A453J457_AEGTS